MSRFVVLLRGVNVGKGNRVPMAGFKSLLEGLGYTEVETLLNSGNAAFNSSGGAADKHASVISRALLKGLGVSTPTIVKSALELSAIVNRNPIVPPDGEHSRFLVAFGPDEMALHGLVPIQRLTQASERMVITKQAGYLHCPGGLLESKAGAAMLGRAGKGVTTRNWATVLKLAMLVGASAA